MKKIFFIPMLLISLWSNAQKSILKVELSDFKAQIYNLNYEHLLGNHFSMEFGLGYTKNAFNFDGSFDEKTILANIGARAYLNHKVEGCQGFYLSPSLFLISTTGTSYFSNPFPTQKEESYYGANFVLGHQFYSSSTGFTFDAGFGVGRTFEKNGTLFQLTKLAIGYSF